MWPRRRSSPGRFLPLYQIPLGGMVRAMNEHGRSGHGNNMAHSGHEGHSDHNGHDGHTDHTDHTGHAGHGDHAAQFKDRFWISLVLAVPVVFFSAMFADLLGYTPPDFAGSGLIAPVLGTVIFL